MATMNQSNTDAFRLPEIPGRLPGLVYPEDLEYIAAHQEEYEIWVWEHYKQIHPEIDQPVRPKSYPHKSGTLYVIQVEGFYKIGITAGNLASRLGQIQTSCPFEVELVWDIASSDIYDLEVFLHEHFQDRRVRGEWFELSQEDIAFIKTVDGAE